MPTQINLDEIIAENPNVDAEELRKGRNALEELQRTGVVRRSGYSLTTPESKKELRPERTTSDCLGSFRKLY